MEKREIYAIKYWNGESYDEAWSGILPDAVYSTIQLAENKVKELQIEHDLRIVDEIAQGYMYPPNKRETWKVVPITYYYKDIPSVNPDLLGELNES